LPCRAGNDHHRDIVGRQGQSWDGLTGHPVTLESHLRARYFLAKLTPADVERAIGWFERAIASDALFAEAHVGLANACIYRGLPLGADLSVTMQRQFLARGKEAAERALDLDEKLGEAHAAIGLTFLFHDWNWPGAERALERALELGSNSPYSHANRAILASTKLDHAETLEQLRSAIDLDPVNLLVRAEAGEICYWVRDYSQAIAYASQTLEFDPAFPRAHFVLGRVYEAQGKIEEAITEYEQAGLVTASGAAAARRAFERGRAAAYHRWALRARLWGMGSRSVDGAKSPRLADIRRFYCAKAYARLGEVHKAVDCLEQSHEERECMLVLLKAAEWCDPLRSDAHFEDLVRRVGIP
jgi:tetratricopeptide (TPR) repeat protein